MNSASEPKWPLLIGSLVPIAALFLSGGHGGGLGEAAVGGVIVVSVGLYLLLSFPLEAIVIAGFSKRSFVQCLQVSYSMQSWKLSSFILGCQVFSFCAGCCYGLMRFLGPVGSFLTWASNSIFSIILPLVSFVIGIAIIELGHRVKMTKGLLVALIVTQIAVFGALHGFWHMWLLQSRII